MTLWLLRPVITHPPGILAKTSVTLLGGQLGHVGVKSVRRRSSSSHKDSRATLGWFMFWRTGCHWPREAEPVLQCPVKAGHQPTGRRSCLIPSQALDYDPVESGHHKFKNQTKQTKPEAPQLDFPHVLTEDGRAPSTRRCPPAPSAARSWSSSRPCRRWHVPL